MAPAPRAVSLPGLSRHESVQDRGAKSKTGWGCPWEEEWQGEDVRDLPEGAGVGWGH